MTESTSRFQKVPSQLGVVALAMLAACGDFGEPASPAGEDRTDVQDGRIILRTDAASLQGRVRILSEPLSVMPVATSEGTLVPRAPQGFTLTLVAQLDPPELDGVVLQASHSIIHGSRAYVSYNVQGPVRKGGVDVLKVNQPDEPSLVSSALFTDTDVSAVDNQGATELFLATATGDTSFATPAVLEVVELDGGLLTTTSRRVDLPSFAGTAVRVQGNTLYATSGTGGDPVGGLSVFDRGSLDLLAFDPFEDARAVDFKGGTVVAMRGTPGALRVYDASTNALIDTYESGGANIPESKSTVFLAKGCAFYAAGDEGLRVVDLESGATVTTLAVPDIEDVDPENEVTNGASMSGNLVFIANGGAGLFVAQANKDLDDEGDDDSGCSDLTLELLGQVQFPGDESANFVASKGKTLFVANGLGGLSIIKIEQ